MEKILHANGIGKGIGVTIIRQVGFKAKIVKKRKKLIL